MRNLARLLAIAVAATACSGGGSASPGLAPNQIAVSGLDGRITIVDPDTGVETVVADQGAGAVQPAWSPDGRQLVWTEVDADGRARLVSTDGEGGASVDLPFASFYNQWAPGAQHVASLGSSVDGVSLALTQPADGRVAQVATGLPLFVSWRDDGAQLALNSSGSLQVIDIGGELLFDSPASPLFQAPIWIPGTDNVIAVLDRAQRSVVSIIDVMAGTDRPLLSVSVPVAMVLDSTGSRLAIVHAGSDDGVVTASFAVAQPEIPASNGTFVVDLGSGDVTRLTDARRLAPFWAPDSQSLLSLAAEPGSNGAAFRWEVHDLAGLLIGHSDAMVSSGTMIQAYLPFASQYAQTLTPWSPDSSRFVFAGAVAGEDGIWLQDATTEGGSARLTDGEVAVWSPRGA